MTETTSKKANAYLKTDSRELKPVLAKIKELEELHRKVATFLEPHIAPYCQVANIIGRRLILVVANGSIATQLRFQTIDLVRRFREDPILKNINDIHCKVRPFEPPGLNQRPPARKNPNMQPMSHATADIMREIAASIEHPKLREIMEKIAKNSK